MALVPCNVCGSLNSDEAEICLSCGYPTKGSKRSAIFQWTAIAIVLLLAIPLLASLLLRLRPAEPRLLPPEPPSAMQS